MKKRILSILLCLCMAISLLPVTALAEGETIDWSAMYASDSVIKPTPSACTDYKVVWEAADGGVKMTGAYSTAGADRYFGIMLNIPNDAYYNVDFTLKGDSSDSAAGSYMGYVVGQSEFGSPQDGLDHSSIWESQTPKTWSLTELKGTNLQLHYMMVSGSDQSVDNYMVISGVKFTRLTNAVTATASGDGTFDVTSDADFNQAATGATSYSADIGRGSQIKLTAHPNAGSYFDHWEDSNGTSISTDTSITVTVGDSAIDTADKTYKPVFRSGTDPRVAKLLDGNTRNTLTGDSLRITHMGSSWSAPEWVFLNSLCSSIGSATSDSDATLNLTLDVTADDSVFYGLVVPGSSTKGNEAYMTVTVDGNSTTVGGASSADTTKPYCHSFAIPVTKGTHTVSFRLQNADYPTAYLQGLGLVSGVNKNVTLKATDFETIAGCASYTITVNGTDVTDAVKSADGYTAPYGSVAQFESVNADVSQYAFQSWSTGDYSTTAVIPDVDTVAKGQLILRGDVTLTPVYTEGVNVASAIMADSTEKAPDGGTYHWAMNSAAYFSVNEGTVSVAEGGVLTLTFTVPEGEVYMSRIQGNCAFKLYKGETELGSYSSNFPTGYYYSVLDAGSYQMVFTGSSTCVLDNFTCQPYGSMGYGKVNVIASLPDQSDATQELIDSGALPAAEYIFYDLDSLGYVADGYTDKVVKTISLNDLGFILDKTKLEDAGLSALNADKADGSGTVSFNTSGTTLTTPFSNFLLPQDGSYSYQVHVNLQSTGGYPYLSGTTLYANGCPIYVEDYGKVYFYNKTDGSYTEPVKNLATGDAQITLQSGATIYGGSDKADVSSTYVSLAYNDEGYTVYGGGNGYGVTGSSEVVCPGGTVNLINGGNNGNGTKPASITVTGSSSKITAANGVTGGSATGDVTVAVLELEGELTGGSSENGTVTVNAGTTLYSTTITGSIIGVPYDGSAKNVIINTMAAVSGSITGAKTGSNVGNVTVNVSGNAEGLAIAGADNAIVTGDVTVHVTAADIGDSATICGQYNSTVGGDVSVTVNGGNLFSCGDVYGSSGTAGSFVTGKVTVRTNAKVSAHLQGSRGGSVGSVEVTTGGDVTGSVTGLSGGSAGAVTVTANHNVTDAVCAVLDGSVTGDVSLAVNAQAKSVSAVKAASAAATVGGNVTFTMGENASVTDNTVTVLAPVLSASDSIKATITGNVTFHHRMNTLADTVTLSDRDEDSVISGASSMNVYKDNGQQIVLHGGNTGGVVNLFTLYTKPVYVPVDGAAPVFDSSVTGGYFVKKTSDQSGFDLYALVNLTAPIVDDANKRILGNGFPLKVSSAGVSYDSGAGWQSVATGDLSAYTVYGGAEQTDVQNSSITFSGVSAQSPGTYFGGGMNGDVTGNISIKLEGSSSINTDFGRPVTIYGGSENADVTGNLNVSINYDENSSGTNMVTWFAGCKNGDFNGSAKFDIQRDDTYEKDEDDTYVKAFHVFKLPGAFNLCSEIGIFTGNIDLYAGAMDYRTDMTGGIRDAYSTTGKSSGYNTIHLLSYTDSTETSITRASEKTTVTGDGDPNLKSVSWDNGTAVLSYHVVLNIPDEYTSIAEITDTDLNYILYAAGGLYCDRGTTGEEDNADVLVRGFATQYLHYYFGTDNAKLGAGEALTFTMDKAAWVYFYINGPLTLNLNTSLTGNGFNGVVIGDTAESVLITIGRADGGTESYTVNSSGLWYSKLMINKPFDSNYGIPIKSGNNYNEDDITLNLDKSKYATEAYNHCCRLKSVSTVVTEPEEDFIGRVSETGGKLEGYVLIFADGGKNYASVDTDKDGELDDSEKNTKVEITDYYPEALPGSYITMFSGSLDFFSFYGESFTQKGGSVNQIFSVYPASESATISQDAGCTLDYVTIKSAAETTAYTADPTCVINVEIGGYIKSISSSTAAANVKLLSTADPGSDGAFLFSKDSTFGTLDFSEYTLKHLDSTNGYYTDISYFNQNNPVKPNDPNALKIVADGSYYRYCPGTTTGAADIVNVKADLGSVSYGYDASATSVTLDLSSICPYIYDGCSLSSDFELTFDTNSGKVTVKPKSGLEPGIHQGICSINYNNASLGLYSQTFQFPISITVRAQTVTVTPTNGLITYAGSGNTSWKQSYTLTPDVTLSETDKELLVYYGEAAAGAHELHLSKTRSSDNRYNFVLASDKTYNLTISTYNGGQGYPIESAVATVPDTWGTYAMITAPEGYLVSLTENGTYTKSVKWITGSTQPQNDITYYLKDNTSGSSSYLLSLQKTIDGVKVCTDGDLATYASGAVTNTTSSTADVTFSLTLKDETAGACGLSRIYVLAVPTGNAAPTVETVLASGTAATKNVSDYTVALTGLDANTAYTFYAAHTTEAGVKAPNVADLGNATTLGFAPAVATAPNASGVYGMALSELSLTGGTVTGQNGVKLNGSWTWTETDADTIYPNVNGTAAYEATFTPGDTQYSLVTVQVTPAMTPAQISVTGAAAQGRSYEKNNTSVNITGVTFSDGVSLSLGTDYTAAGVMTDDNAGENKAVTVTLTMKNGNYTLSSNTSASTVNISKAEPVTLPNQPVSRRYNMTGEQTISVSGLMPDDAGTLTYAKGTESGDTAMISDWSVETDGTVKYTLLGGTIGDSVTLPVKINSTNYAESTVNVVITLTDKDNQTAPAAFSLKFNLNADETTYTATIPAVDGAEYSFNGTDWSDTNTKSNIAPNESVTGCIRMKATDDKNASDITSSTKTAPLLTVKIPAASPNGGTFSGTQTVTLTCATSGADIYFTTDGSTPTSGSTKYTTAFSVSDTTAVKAIAVKDGMNGSAVLIVTFTKYSGGGTSGGGATATAPGITVPVSTGKGHVEATASVKDNTAIVSMTDAQIKEIATGAETTGTMRIDVSGLEVDAVVIPANVVTAANDTSGSAGLAVALPTGTMTLDKAALASVVGKGDIKFSVETVDNEKLTEPQKSALGSQSSTALVVDVNVFVNGTQTSTFGDGRITVSVPYTPKSGENTDCITVWFIKDDGTIEPKNGMYNAAAGCVEFTTEHLSQYLIVSFPFTDVAVNAWYYGSVAYAYNNGLFAGTSATGFSPDTAMTRQMIWMVLARMDGKTPADMDAARAWAIENGISDGTNPTSSITREQMATILYRYAQYKQYDTTQGGMAIREFTDYDSISEYALTALGWSVNAGLMQGSGNNLMPTGSATRAQVATILQRFCQNVKE